MIKQIAAKKIDGILTRNLKRFGLDILSEFLPNNSTPISFPKTSARTAAVSPGKPALKRPILAPLDSAPVISLSEVPSVLPNSLLPEAEEGVLLMGDVITLAAVESQDIAFSGIITGDGIAHNFLDCIPTSAFVNSDKVQFRLCLFRIEPVRQYGYENIAKTYGKMKNKNPEQMEELKKVAEEEQVDNEDEAEVSYGKPLSFGQRIQLRHIHSNSFITTSREVSKERGCLQVVLDPVGNETSWLEVKSCSLIRQDGETIRYSDNFSLNLVVDQSKYYLHMGVPKSWKEDLDYELNASSNFTHWQARRFISDSAIKQNPEYVATGDSFRILFRQSGGFLSITPRNIDEILPPDSDVDPVKSLRAREKKESTSKIIIEKEPTSLSVWELNRANPFIGGIAEKNEQYRIKHVATGLLLCINKTGGLYLTYERNLDASLFRITQEPSEKTYHTFDTIVKIEAVAMKKVLMAEGTESVDSMFFRSEDAAQMAVSLTFNRKQNAKTTFVLVDEMESRTIYIYQISSLMPKMVVFYQYIKRWGCLKKGNAYIQSFELAKNAEPELDGKVNFLLKILRKIKKRVLVDGPMLLERQDILRQTGFLEMLIRFVILLDKKLELPPKFPVDGVPKQLQKSKLKMIVEGPKYLKEEFLLFPAAVGVRHIMKLAIDVYETIYHSIKSNINSCVELQKHQEFLSSQLYSYKTQVGILLKEFYKMSSGTIAKSNPSLLKVWIEKIKPISEIDENTDEQIITLKILASLCVSDKQGIPMNQNTLADHYFSPERDYIILKCFVNELEPFVGLTVDKTLTFTDFLLKNPKLSSLAMEDKNNILLVYLNSLTENKKIINYMSSFFEFLTNLCDSKNEKVSKMVINTLGMSFDHLFYAASSPKIHCKLRKTYLKLLWTLYFDKDTHITLSKHQERCFLWDPDTNTMEEENELVSARPSIFDKLKHRPIPLAKATDWISTLWGKSEYPFGDFKSESLADQIRFVIELINFSKNLIDHGYTNYGFVTGITPYIIGLIEEKPRGSKEGWTLKLKSKLYNLRNEELHIDFIKAIIDFFQIKYFAKINSEVKNILNEYLGYDEEPQVSNRPNGKILDKKEGESKDRRRGKGEKENSGKLENNEKLENSENREKLEIQEKHGAIEQKEENEKNEENAKIGKKDIKEIKETIQKPNGNKKLNKIKVGSFQETEIQQEASIDTMLLNLLFNHTNRSLKEKTINLLLCSFDLNSRLLSSFKDIVLLPKCPMRDSYLILKKSITDCEVILNKLRFIDPQVLLSGLTQENPELEVLRDTLKSKMQAIKSCITKKTPPKVMGSLQKICRNLAFHKIILNLFTEEWPWIEKSDSHMKLQENTRDLYEVTIKTLVNFCYNNTDNQLLLLDYLPLIESFKGNLIDTKGLLAEVLKSKRSHVMCMDIIKQIFFSMSKRAKPMDRPQDLYVIKNLIYDENLKFIYANQTTIIKSLLTSRNLQAVFSCDTTWDLSKYSSKGIKFFSTMLDIISWSSIFNEFATHQARRMIPYKVIIREMGNTSMLLIKKAYLHFLFYVFFMKSDNIERELPETILEEILENIICRDVARYKNYIEQFTTLCLRGMYSPVLLIKTSEAQGKANNASIDGKKGIKKAKLDGLTRDQAEALEYWKYLNSHKPGAPRISSGLLCVIRDITQECKINESLHERVIEILQKIKGELQNMLDDFYHKMLQCEEIDLEFMVKEICMTMLEIPYFTKTDKYEEECFNLLLEFCKQYLEDNYITLQDFVDSNLIFEADIISRVDFIALIKVKLMMRLRVEEIEAISKYLEPSDNPDICITKIIENLKSQLIGNKYIVRKERVITIEKKPHDYHENAERFEGFILGIEDRYKEGDNDISLMVNNLKSALIDPALAKNDTEVLAKLIKNLSHAFYKPDHKIYLINILKQILLQEMNGYEKLEEEESGEKLKIITAIQNLYSNENVIEICFAEFNKEAPHENTTAALDLLCNLVSLNNTHAKQQVLNYLKISGFSIFSFIKAILRESQDLLSSSLSSLSSSRNRTLTAKTLPTRSNKRSLRTIMLAQKILLFIQLCCDNCFLPFQEFFQVQNPLNLVANIDLVSEILQLLTRLEGISDLKEQSMSRTVICDIAIQCIKTLTDCCQGPCLSNQIVLGQSRRLYEFMNWLFTNNSPDFTIETIWLSIYTEGIKFLNALIEANTNLKVAKIFIREVNLEVLKNHAAIIWDLLVKGREKIFYQDNQGISLGINCLELSEKPFEEFQKNVIEIGFGIYILLLTLQYMHPAECNSKLASLKAIDMTKSQDTQGKEGFVNSMKGVLRRISNSKVQEEIEIQNLDPLKAQDFYYSNIASVEINNRDNLAKLFFRVPTICRYMTAKSRTELTTKVNRTSHQEKIEDFCHKSLIYEVEMRHQQKIARYPLFDAIISKWRLYGKISYFTVICINLILITTVQHVAGNEGAWEFAPGINTNALLTLIAVVQIFLAGMVYICYIFEYLPVIKYKSGLKSKGSKTQKYLTSAFNRIKGTELMKEVLFRTETEKHREISNMIATFQIIFLDFECVYNLCYFIISILSWEWTLLYSILLLDLIKRNNDLKNILKSITLNGYQLFLTTFLGVLVIYIFSIVAFLYFSYYYSSDFSAASTVTYCDTLVDCLVSTIITGIRQGGGIGDGLLQPILNGPVYWEFMVFNILYFAIVIKLLLNIIFGIIIDTFGELREKNQAEMKDIKENCFICGNQRFLFEARRISWGYHINIEHNPNAYLAFLLYIRHKPVDECSGAEKYVKEKLEKYETSYFPLTSLSLISGDDDDDKEELDEVEHKVTKILELANKITAG